MPSIARRPPISTWLAVTIWFLPLWTSGFCGIWESNEEVPGVRAIGILDAMSEGPDIAIATTEKTRSWGYGAVLSSLASTILQSREDPPQYLENNTPIRGAITPGATQQFIFPLSQMIVGPYLEAKSVPFSGDSTGAFTVEESHAELKRGLKGHTVHLSLAVCRQPGVSGSQAASPKGLEMFVSSGAEESSDENSRGMDSTRVETEEGLATYVHEFGDDIRLAIQAPNVEGRDGQYTYEITASIDNLFTSYDERQSLVLVDRDHEAGLFSTKSLVDSGNLPATESWMESGAPFTIFVHRRDEQAIVGLRKSYCGLESSAQIQTTSIGVEKLITTIGTGSARQQFYVPGLNSSTSYHAILGLPSNYSRRGTGVPTGGGTVWKSAEFATNTDGSCQVLHDLKFCDAVSYAAPAPANGSLNATEVGQIYDSYASNLFNNFSLSLQQIPCDTTPEAQYSLATNCTNCANAYKQWLCAVAIPRCAETNKNTSASIARTASTSRSAMIQEQIQPGPYNEIPPCGGLCFGLVQNCPASFGFSCPDTGSWYFNQSYGYPGGNESDPTCNSPGAIFEASSGSIIHPSRALTMVVIIVLVVSAG